MSKKYLGVREWSYTGSGLYGSQQHNFNMDYRKALPHIDHTKSKNNIRVNGDLSLENHYSMINEFNSNQLWNSYKLDTKLSKNRTVWYDTDQNKKLLKSEYTSDDPNHKEDTFEEIYTANKSAIEQVLYFSNSINEEDLSQDDWIAVMKNWASHMKSKFGRLMINSVVHLNDEKSSHIHCTFSCLKKDNSNNIIYQNPQINKSGYGSSLQDDFDKVFNATINQNKLIETYNRGEKKQSYREVGNDHTRSKDHQEQLETVNSIVESVADEQMPIYETLKHIRGLKAIYKGNPQASKLLNKLQGAFKKINKQEDKSEEYIKSLVSAQDKINSHFMDKLQTMEELVNLIKDNESIAEIIISNGGKHLLKEFDIQKDRDRILPHPTPDGMVMKLSKGKINSGTKLDIQAEMDALPF